DLVVASTDTRIGALEARCLGPAGAAASVHINRILGTKATKRAGYTAVPMTGEEAWRLGLVYRCAPPDRIVAVADELATQIATQPPTTLRYLKARLRAAEALLDTNVP